MKSREVSSESCDTCESGYFCTRLHTVLALLRGKIEAIDDPVIVARYRHIEENLIQFGYDFPNGTKHCEYSKLPENIRSLTDELIGILNSVDGQPATKAIQ